MSDSGFIVAGLLALLVLFCVYKMGYYSGRQDEADERDGYA